MSEGVSLTGARGRRLRVEPTAAHTGGQALVHFGVDAATGEHVALKVAIEPGEAGAWLDEERTLLEELAGIPGLGERIVPVLDHGTWGTRAFYAMPRYGETLDRFVAAEPSLAERLRAALEVVRTVEALHAAGDGRYVHRDIKPTNVMRAPDGRWLLGDFGAARRRAPGLSGTSSAFHSRGFAPPEQALPIKQVARPEWDAFALAATAFFCAVGRAAAAPMSNGLCLTSAGRRVVAGRDPGPVGPEQLLDYRRMRALEPEDREELRAAVGPTLAGAIEGMLAPDPRRRRGDVGTLARALEAEIATPGAGRRAGRRLALAAVGVSLAVLGGALLRAPEPEPDAAPAAGCPEGMAQEAGGCVSPSGLRMVRVPAGPAAIGTPPDEPGRAEDLDLQVVTIERPFLIAGTETTQGLWEAVTGENPVRSARLTARGGLFGTCASDGTPVGEDQPVSCVTLAEVAAFANALSAREGLPEAYRLVGEGEAVRVRAVEGSPGYRLPTEAEWEVAARAGTSGPVPAEGEVSPCAAGNVADRAYGTWMEALLSDLPNTAAAVDARVSASCDDGRGAVAPVGQFEANPLGLYDVLGNVAELTGDRLDPDGDLPVARGGSFASGARIGDRVRVRFDTRIPSVGFRLARSLPPDGARPVRRVVAAALPPFEVDRTEVTQGEWQDLLSENPVVLHRETVGGIEGTACGALAGGLLVGRDLPVVCVDWYDAVRFANARSVRDGLRPAYRIDGRSVTWDRGADGWRLPTGGEWTAAAGPTRFPGTDDPDDLCRFGNVFDAGARVAQPADWAFTSCADPHPGLAPAASYLPRRLVFDLMGNAAEWTWDEVERAGVRAVRGGAWRPVLGDAADREILRSYAVDEVIGLPADTRASTVGLRLVKDVR